MLHFLGEKYIVTANNMKKKLHSCIQLTSIFVRILPSVFINGSRLEFPSSVWPLLSYGSSAK